jgi:hypothetical protein
MKQNEKERVFELLSSYLTIAVHQFGPVFKTDLDAKVATVDALAQVARMHVVTSQVVYEWQLRNREDWPDLAPSPAPLFDGIASLKDVVDKSGDGG